MAKSNKNKSSMPTYLKSVRLIVGISVYVVPLTLPLFIWLLL